MEWLDDVVEFLDNVVEALWPRTDANSYKQAFGFYPGSFVGVVANIFARSITALPDTGVKA